MSVVGKEEVEEDDVNQRGTVRRDFWIGIGACWDVAGGAGRKRLLDGGGAYSVCMRMFVRERLVQVI